MHSATKLNGHSDVAGVLAVARDDALWQRIATSALAAARCSGR
jgi:cystathionine beta-lyase/cystathionine gamma-synthase